MSKEKRKSYIWSFLIKIAERFRSLMLGSQILRLVGEFPDTLEKNAERRSLGKILLFKRNRHRQVRLYFHCMKAHEESLVLKLCSRLLKLLSDLSLNAIGRFLLLYGGFSILISFLKINMGLRTDPLYLYLLISLSSIPLLLSNRSLRAALWKSAIGEWFLSKICFLQQAENESYTSKEKQHPVINIFFAFLCAVIGFFAPLSTVLGAVAFFAAIGLIAFLPELLFLAICVVFPFFSMLRHGTILLVGSLLLLTFFWGWKTLCGKRLVHFGIDGFLIALLGVNFLFGGLIGGGGREGILSGLLHCFLIFSFFVTQSIFARPIWRGRTIAALHCGGIACSLLGIWQALFGNLDIRWVDLNRFLNAPTRVVGTFSNPNFLALYLVLILPLAIGELCILESGHLRRFFFALAVIFETVCLLLTYSRGAWVGLAVSLFVFLLLGSAKTLATLFVSPFFAIATIPFLPQKILSRLSSIVSRADSSVRYRFYTWRGILKMIKDHPWGIGVGERAFSSYYPHYAISGIETVMHAHRLDLQILLELGIGGFVVFVLLVILLICRLIWGCWHLAERKRMEFLGAGSAVIGALTMGLFDHIWYHKGLFALFWIVLSSFFALCSNREA